MSNSRYFPLPMAECGAAIIIVVRNQLPMMTTAQLRVRVNTALKVTTPVIRRYIFWQKGNTEAMMMMMMMMMRKGE
jgi:hypothetical protein